MTYAPIITVDVEMLFYIYKNIFSANLYRRQLVEVYGFTFFFFFIAYGLKLFPDLCKCNIYTF